jgi:Flp pilus assembly protein TadG
MSFVFNRRRRFGNAGVTTMEVAIAFLVFIPLIFSVIDLSRYFFSQQALTTLASAAARNGLVNFTTGGGAQCAPDPAMATNSWAAGVANYAPLLDPSQVTVSVCVGQSNNPVFSAGVMQVTAVATYNFTPLTPGLAVLLGPMVATVSYQF